MKELLSKIQWNLGKSAIFENKVVWTFSELNQASDAKAKQLLSYLGDDIEMWPDVIPVISERSSEYIATILGCWKLGIGVVPLAKDIPQARFQHIVEDLDANLVINLSSTPQGGGVIEVNLDAAPTEISEPLPTQINDTGIAYVIYTSGTTGKPKGCVVGIESLLPIVDSFCKYYEIDQNSRMTFCANIAFDAAMMEWLPALLSGASLYVVSNEVIFRPESLVNFYSSNQITFSWLPTPLAEIMMADESIALPDSLKVLQTAGQRLTRRTPKHWHTRVENAYGPTETTVIATSHAVTSKGDKLPEIGTALPGVKCFVVDEHMKEVSTSVEGELLIAGVGLSRGYHNLPELTAERFITFEANNGEQLKAYRTGDICRFNRSGVLEYISRIDNQLKVNGFRVEGEEVIYNLLADKCIDQAHVMGHRNGSQDFLIAYIVAQQEVDTEQVKRKLAIELPDYMIPTYIIQLDKFPLTANHKLDEAALRRTLKLVSDLSDCDHKLSDDEKSFLNIFREQIGGQIGWKDQFFQYGGNSIAAIIIAAEVHKRFDLVLPFELFESKGTPQKLWDSITKVRFINTEIARHLDSDSEYTDVPLSSSQRSIWFFANMDTEDRAYHAKSQLMLQGNINPEAVAYAIQKVVDRHSIFRTAFLQGEGDGLQRVFKDYTVDLAQYNFSHLSEQDSEQALQHIVQEELNQSFDLASLPLVRWGLVKLSADKSVLVHIEHHLVHDGWSYNLFLKDFIFYYRAFVEESNAELDFPLQYADFCITQANWLESELQKQELTYWHKQLTGAPAAINLPTHYTDTDDPRAGQTLRIQLPRKTWQAVEQMAKQRAETPFSIMLAVYYMMLSRFSSDSDICVGSAFSNRQWLNADSIIGMMINTVALRYQLQPEMTFNQVLKGAAGVVQKAQRYQALPFEYLVNAIKPERVPGVNPLFQVFFGFHDSPMPELDLPGVEYGQVLEAIDSRAAKFDLSVVVIPRKGQLGDDDPVHLLWEFKRARFPKWLIENMIEDYLALLTAVIETPDVSLNQLTPNVPQLAGPAVEYPMTSVYQAVLDQAHRSPQASALFYQGEVYTYQELIEQVHHKAAYLVDLAIKPKSMVGICLPREANFVLWMLACQAAGIGYIPIDPDYPQQRKQYIIEHSQISHLITDKPSSEVHCIAPEAMIETDFQAVNVQADWPMYCIYTSGSTGLPKGVQISYSAFSNFIQAMQKQLCLSGSDKWLAITSFSFDISTLEIYLPLMSGAQVHLATQQATRNVPQLVEYIESQQITHCQATPSTWRALSSSGWRPSAKMHVLTGGEALDLALAAILAENNSHCYNMYGPTETTVWSSMQTFDKQRLSIALGTPIANTQFWILDHQLNQVPVGAIGELWISGYSLASGYLHAEQLTQQRFIEHPRLQQRLYKTGDLVALDNNHQIKFYGRQDNQVKISGHRIELDEIEQVIKQYKAVQQAAVVIRELSMGSQIIAFFAGDVDEVQLRAHCSQKLANYMVPHQFLQLKQLPLTPNYKVDRKALPQSIELTAIQHHHATPTESKLNQIFGEYLGQSEVDMEHHFYKLGGNSLMAMKACSRIRLELGVEMKGVDLIELGTLRAVASFIDALNDSEQEFCIAEELTL